MFKSLKRLLACVALLLSIQVGSWSAETPGAETPATGNPVPAAVHSAAEGAYASEVPESEIIGTQDRTLAADKEEGSIPVADELDFVRGNSFRRSFEETLKTVAKVDYYGTRYVDCEHYPLEIHAARPNQIRTLVKTGDSSRFEGTREHNQSARSD